MSKTRSNKHDDDEKKKKKIKTGTAKTFFKPEEYDYSSFNIYPQWLINKRLSSSSQSQTVCVHH